MPPKEHKSKRKEAAAPVDEAPPADDAQAKQAAKQAKKAKKQELRRLEAKENLAEEQDEHMQEPAIAPNQKASKRTCTDAEIQDMIDEIDAQIEDEDGQDAKQKEAACQAHAHMRRRHTKKRPATPEASPEQEVDAAEEPQDGLGEQVVETEAWTDDEWKEWWKFKGWDTEGWGGEESKDDVWETCSQDRQPDFPHLVIVRSKGDVKACLDLQPPMGINTKTLLLQ